MDDVFSFGGKAIPFPMPSPMVTGTVYHYTNAQGLCGILQSGAFFASAVTSMNDLGEVSYGLDVVRSVWSRFRETMNNAGLQRKIEDALIHTLPSALLSSTYVISASESGDQLNQWQSYAGRRGYAIGLDTARDLAPVWSELAPIPAAPIPDGLEPYAPVFPPAWYRVIYDEEEQVRRTRDALAFAVRYAGPKDSSTAGLVYMMAAVLVPQFKARAFADEREVRFIVTPSERFSGTRFRAGRFGVVPYVTVKAVSTNEFGGFYTPPPGERLPVEEVVCGPLAPGDQALDRSNVVRMLHHFGYRGAGLRSSTMTYRDQ